MGPVPTGLAPLRPLSSENDCTKIAGKSRLVTALILFERGWSVPFDAADRQGAAQETVGVAHLRFDSGVPEVFAVTVLTGRRYAELIDDEMLLKN